MDVDHMAEENRPPVEKRGKLAREYAELFNKVEKLSLEEQQMLLASLKADELLTDLPTEIDSDYIENLIKIETGSAFNIYVVKFTGEKIPLVVSSESTVHDIKQGLKRIISKQEEGAMEPRKISWKYVWRTYVLQHGSTRLSDDNARLGDLGVGKDSELVFNKVRREKWAQKN